jgi:hypothetical protein
LKARKLVSEPQFSIVAAASLAVGCVHNFPDSLAPSTVPVPEHYQTSGLRTAETCDTRLFGIIPITKYSTMAELVGEAEADDDALISVTIDRRHSWWLLGSTSCTVISGVGVRFIRVSSGAVQQPDTRPLTTTPGSRSSTTSGPLQLVPDLPVLNDQTRQEKPPESAVRIAEIAYQSLGWAPEDDYDRWNRDIWAVADAMGAGITGGEILRVVMETEQVEQAGIRESLSVFGRDSGGR